MVPQGRLTSRSRDIFQSAADGHAVAAGVEESELGQQACTHCGDHSQSAAPGRGVPWPFYAILTPIEVVDNKMLVWHQENFIIKHLHIVLKHFFLPVSSHF